MKTGVDSFDMAPRRGRRAGDVLSLSEAVGMVASLASLDASMVMERVKGDVKAHFPHARGSGDRWRVPERDVWSLLGQSELMTPREVAEALRFCPKTINRKLLRGDIPHVVVFGERRIRRVDYLGLQIDGRAAVPRRAFSFFGEAAE